MPPSESLLRALTRPTVADLWRLRGDLLETGLPADARAFAVLAEFRGFLDRLETSTTSRDYSRLASLLDIGAVSGVVAEHALDPEGAGRLAERILAAALSEGLMVLATRQHVKAWEGELAAVYRGAAWYLYGELWRWARERKPELARAERRALLDRLLGPVHAAGAPGLYKAALLGRLFQLLLVSSLAGDAGSEAGR